jgi:8-oxo-dGTP pyrophosphatase MutT (NUDIX family)
MTDKTAATASDRTERLNRQIRENLPAVKPRDSATLILIDRAHGVPKVLLGRRHERHRFLPGKFVFPGGRIEADDRLMPSSGALHGTYVERLASKTKRPSAAKAAGFALAAVRETYEETGMMLGKPVTGNIAAPAGIWQEFAKAGILPDLSQIHFIARAITPPGRPLRFDSRFFAAEVEAVARRDDGFIGPDKELVELVWLPLNEAKSLDMPGITAVALEELQDRINADMSPDHPVPLYRMLNKRFVRQVL